MDSKNTIEISVRDGQSKKMSIIVSSDSQITEMEEHFRLILSFLGFHDETINDLFYKDNPTDYVVDEYQDYLDYKNRDIKNNPPKDFYIDKRDDDLILLVD